MTSEKDSAQQRVLQLHNTLQECQEGETLYTITCSYTCADMYLLCVCVDKRVLDDKLSTAQAQLHQQEELQRRGERDRRALNDKIKELERIVLNTETERKRVEVRGQS